MVESKTYRGNGHTAVIADPGNITQDECLALARCGVDAWNQWRDEFPSHWARSGNVAKFIEVNFIDEEIDFSGFRFGDVSFSKARFGWRQKFQHCKFGQADFSQSFFERAAYFDGSIFSSSDFQGATFYALARFSSTLLGGTSRFQSCVFNQAFFFTGTCTTGDVHFDGAIFFENVHFSGAIFLDEACFECCEFKKDAFFDGRLTHSLRQAFRSPPYSNAWNEIEKRIEKSEDAPRRFSSLNFDGALFGGRAVFRGREFTGRTSFDLGRKLRESRTKVVDGEEVLEEVYDHRPVEFARPPEFFDSKLCQQVSFDHARFPAPLGSPEAARCYRVLKQAFAAHQALREEQRFFRLEMAEEAGMAWSLRGLLSTAWVERKQPQKTELPPARLFYKLYAVLSNFGFSVARPVASFFSALLVAAVAYASQAGLSWCGDQAVACSMTDPLIQFTLGQALPGFEKFAEPATKALFGDQPGVWTVLTLLLHKAVSVLALFLIGLALRNLFKMK